MSKIKIALLAAGAFCAASLAAGSASAMPVGGLAAAGSEVSGDLQQVRWVCGPFVAGGVPGLASMAGRGGAGGASIGTMASMDGPIAITGDRDFMRVPGGVWYPTPTTDDTVFGHCASIWRNASERLPAPRRRVLR